MMQIRTCRHNGCCGSCGSWQDENTRISEIRMSVTGHGWSTFMLCDACREELWDMIYEEDRKRRNMRRR